jgi:hypothetical protein
MMILHQVHQLLNDSRFSRPTSPTNANNQTVFFHADSN